jgi:hypothetical protein
MVQSVSPFDVLYKEKNLLYIMLPGKDLAKPCTIAISWTHVPVASKLGAAPLKQSRHNGTFHLMKSRNRSRCFAHVFPCRMIYSTFISLTVSNKTAKRSE